MTSVLPMVDIPIFASPSFDDDLAGRASPYHRLIRFELNDSHFNLSNGPLSPSGTSLQFKHNMDTLMRDTDAEGWFDDFLIIQPDGTERASTKNETPSDSPASLKEGRVILDALKSKLLDHVLALDGKTEQYTRDGNSEPDVDLQACKVYAPASGVFGTTHLLKVRLTYQEIEHLHDTPRATPPVTRRVFPTAAKRPGDSGAAISRPSLPLSGISVPLPSPAGSTPSPTPSLTPSLTPSGYLPTSAFGPRPSSSASSFSSPSALTPSPLPLSSSSAHLPASQPLASAAEPLSAFSSSPAPSSSVPLSFASSLREPRGVQPTQFAPQQSSTPPQRPLAQQPVAASSSASPPSPSWRSSFSVGSSAPSSAAPFSVLCASGDATHIEKASTQGVPLGSYTASGLIGHNNTHNTDNQHASTLNHSNNNNNNNQMKQSLVTQTNGSPSVLDTGRAGKEVGTAQKAEPTQQTPTPAPTKTTAKGQGQGQSPAQRQTPKEETITKGTMNVSVGASEDHPFSGVLHFYHEYVHVRAFKPSEGRAGSGQVRLVALARHRTESDELELFPKGFD